MVSTIFPRAALLALFACLVISSVGPSAVAQNVTPSLRNGSHGRSLRPWYCSFYSSFACTTKVTDASKWNGKKVRLVANSGDANQGYTVFSGVSPDEPGTCGGKNLATFTATRHGKYYSSHLRSEYMNLVRCLSNEWNLIHNNEFKACQGRDASCCHTTAETQYESSRVTELQNCRNNLQSCINDAPNNQAKDSCQHAYECNDTGYPPYAQFKANAEMLDRLTAMSMTYEDSSQCKQGWRMSNGAYWLKRCGSDDKGCSGWVYDLQPLVWTRSRSEAGCFEFYESDGSYYMGEQIMKRNVQESCRWVWRGWWPSRECTSTTTMEPKRSAAMSMCENSDGWTTINKANGRPEHVWGKATFTDTKSGDEIDALRYLTPLKIFLEHESSGTGGCFSEAATVELESGNHVLLKDVQIGDRVHIGNGEYSTVYLFSHKEEDITTIFYEITTTDSKITLTRDHFIMSDATMVRAKHVREGSQLQLADGSLSTVTSVRHTVDRGLYNAYTMSGTIAVDGVVASTYAGGRMKSVWMKHALMAPIRVAYQAAPSWVQSWEVNDTTGEPLWWSYIQAFHARFYGGSRSGKMSSSLLGHNDDGVNSSNTMTMLVASSVLVLSSSYYASDVKRAVKNHCHPLLPTFYALMLGFF